ncbi:MAG TPA: 3-methyladenine DNA glycosylase [Rhodospirillales bacterium]|nr:3-methyladenine DNA glycosylase [Rhodospirillales bacterium]
MRKFDQIFAIAAKRKGDLEQRIADWEAPKTKTELTGIPEDRWLSCMTRCVFQAGFNWKVVEAMWPGFEVAFEGFDVGRATMLNDDDLARLVSDKRIIRNGQKISSVQRNAVFLNDLVARHGSAGAFFGGWPSDDFSSLLTLMKKQGSRLGGNTGRYFLRSMGVNSFLLSRDVTARLIAEGVVDKEPTSQKDMAAVQQAFNTWCQQSGHGLTYVSRILALSVGI